MGTGDARFSELRILQGVQAETSTYLEQDTLRR